MHAHLFEKARAKTLEWLDASDGELSLHEIAKRLNNVLGTPIQPGELASIRLEWSQRRIQQARAQRVQEERREKMTQPKCSNCGGAHFVSQCTQPFPEKPIQLSELAEASPASVEKLISDAAEAEIFAQSELEASATQLTKEEAMDSSSAPKAEVIVTAPHPDARKRTVAGMMLRRQWLNEQLDKDPGADPLKLLLDMRVEGGKAKWIYKVVKTGEGEVAL